MIRRALFLLFIVLSFLDCTATIVKGTVIDVDGNPLAFASISVQGTKTGVSANAEGFYELNLLPGKYKVSCQYVGFAKQERIITVGVEVVRVDFVLQKQELILPDVVISNKEDPAYRLIREMIRQQEINQQRAEQFSCMVYSKGQLRLRNFPTRFLSQKVDFEDGDTSKKKILYLSETVSRYSQRGSREKKVEVLSSKVSGDSDGFGLAVPDQYSFYNNVILPGTRLNPRGFISPLSSSTFLYYRFKLLGSFVENNKVLSRIQVIPKRKSEPVFAGEITIIQEDWQLYSLDLTLLRTQQLEFVDTLKLVQLYREEVRGEWMLASQVLYPAAKKFGFDAYGSFLNVYSDYTLHPNWNKKFFDRFLLRYADSANRRTAMYWDEVRPVPLTAEELLDYFKKDSLEQRRRDPAYLDSLNRVRNKFTFPRLLLTGQPIYSKQDKFDLSINSLIDQVSFNPAEGFVLQPQLRWQYKWDSTGSRKQLNGNLILRTGFGNRHFNPYTTLSYVFGTQLRSSITVGVGRQVLQFNGQSPITDKGNSFSSLLYEENRIKSYEALVFRLNYAKGLGAGLSMQWGIRYEDRTSLDNRTAYSWIDKPDRAYTPNYPIELVNQNIIRHQVADITVSFRWQPGTRYIKLPERIVNVGSDKPIVSFQLTQTLGSLAGNDARYTKWRLGVTDNLNFGLQGILRYRLAMGGFLNNRSVPLADRVHFNGNASQLANEYLNSFQLLSLYKLSHIESFYTLGHIEYNLKGFLTNKIPLVKKLKPYLVLGANACYISTTRNHWEWFVGADNLLKQIRIDYVVGYQPSGIRLTGIRIGVKGL
ncbi:MAG: DUF5686 and carboxypeptidase regulatory-like domain-containing protein [Bacteroidota bacterium]